MIKDEKRHGRALLEVLEIGIEDMKAFEVISEAYKCPFHGYI